MVDETPECESALAFAASRALRTQGQLALLYVIEPDVDFQWLGVEDVAREEGHNKAKAVFRLFGRKLKAMGFEDLVPEEIVREGMKAEEITKLIEDDEDIGVLVLGASKDPSGPGPLVTTLAGRQARRHLPGADHRGAGPSLDRGDSRARLSDGGARQSRIRTTRSTMIRDYADHAANERTFLAWLRTGIAVVAFGFVIEKFNLFVLTLAGADLARCGRSFAFREIVWAVRFRRRACVYRRRHPCDTHRDHPLRAHRATAGRSSDALAWHPAPTWLSV